MAEIVPLDEAVAELVRDGDVVALEGFTHLIPHAAGHELIRQGRRDLTLVRMTPDVVYDQLIGMGCARKLVFSWGGNPGVGSLHRLRDAVEHGWPRAARARGALARGHGGGVRGRRGEPAVRRAARLRGQRPRRRARRVARVTCPFTGEELAAVPALRPGRRHRPRAAGRPAGNVQLWGILGVQKEAVLAVDAVARHGRGGRRRARAASRRRRPAAWVVDAVAVAPGGAHPSYAHGYYDRDNEFYVAWDEISRDRETLPRLDAHARDSSRRPAPA